MIKDIPVNEVKNVAVAIVREGGDDSEDWNVYLINLNDFPITGVFITSKGYGELDNEARKTSELRWFYEQVGAKDIVKVEAIVEDVFGLHNEYWVSYYIGSDIFDKRFIFLAESIKPENFTNVPILNVRGVMIV